MNRPTIFAASLALGLSSLLVCRWSEAKSQFPSDIQKALPGMPITPQCNLCHLNDKTDKGTVVTPFGWSMRARGLTGSDATLAPAIAQMRADAVDSDGDGVTDIDELEAGTDPNTPAPVALDADEPGYGCGGKPPVGRPGRGAFPGALVAALAAAARKLRRRRP